MTSDIVLSRYMPILLVTFDNLPNSVFDIVKEIGNINCCNLKSIATAMAFAAQPSNSGKLAR